MATGLAVSQELTNKAGDHRGRASPSGPAGDRCCRAGASVVLAGRALRAPVASVPNGFPRTTAVVREVR
jgi:hypothetical protein